MERSQALSWANVGPGVEQRLFERVAGAAFRQTRILRLAAGAELLYELHSGGEDLLVTEGALRSAEGTHPAGTYIGLPPHDRLPLVAPWGCTLFAKSRPTARRARVIVATKTAAWERSHTPGFWLMRLDEQADGRTVLLRFDPGTALSHHRHDGGEEFLVLRGTLRDDAGTYEEGTWVRQPPGSAHRVASDDGCLLFTVAGHLGE